MYWYYPECTGDILTQRKGHTATAVEDKVYVFGGGDGPTFFNDLYVLDTSNKIFKFFYIFCDLYLFYNF